MVLKGAAQIKNGCSSSNNLIKKVPLVRLRTNMMYWLILYLDEQGVIKSKEDKCLSSQGCINRSTQDFHKSVYGILALGEIAISDRKKNYCILKVKLLRPR